MPRTSARAVAAVLAALAVTAALVAAWSGYRNGAAGSWKSPAMTAVWVVPGVLVAAARPRLVVGWLALAEALLFAAAGLADQWTRLVASDGAPAAGVGWAIWVTDRFSALLVVGFWLLLVLLPDGRLPSPRWRPVATVVVTAQLVLITVFATARGPAAGPDTSLPAELAGVANPAGVLPASWGAAVEGLDVPVLQLPLLLCLLAVVLRLRGATPVERARVVTVLLAAGTTVLVVVLGHAFWEQAAGVLDVLAAAVLATALTATVLGRRTRAVVALVRESLVVTLLAALVGGLTAGAVALAGSELSAFGTGALVGGLALAAHPLRVRLQRWLDRLMRGDLADPYRALQSLAERTHRAPTVDDVLEGVAASAAASLRVPFATAEAGGRRGTVGTSVPEATALTAPLVSGTAVLGQLTVAPGPGRRLTGEERRLLDDLGRHAGLAVQAVLLADELRAGRQRLVVAREEERRRLRRDLHDEVGPTLAGLSMQLGVVRTLVADPTAAERLGLLQDAARSALATLRRIAHDLRPPALDELGLVGALVQLAESLGLRLDHDEPTAVRLPAAVEVAAYRIGAEALHNVVRHAGTDRARLGVELVGEELLLEVADAGIGRASGARPGVGLLSMRERAAELGGSVEVESGPGRGTTVTARLPVRAVAGVPA